MIEEAKRSFRTENFHNVPNFALFHLFFFDVGTLKKLKSLKTISHKLNCSLFTIIIKLLILKFLNNVQEAEKNSLLLLWNIP